MSKRLGWMRAENGTELVLSDFEVNQEGRDRDYKIQNAIVDLGVT